MKKTVLFLICVIYALGMKAQNYTYEEMGQSYPVSEDRNKYVVSGFVPFQTMEDDRIFGNTLLWVIENVCPKLREGITNVNVHSKTFTCRLVLESPADSRYNNIYYCEATFRVSEGKLVFYLSDILIESPVFVMKKVIPIEKLQPEKKESHKRTIEDFVKMESQILNRLFDSVQADKLSPITHWTDISIGKPVKGMSEDECRLAFGKPQSILESNGEVQWMYSSSFYLFFKEGLLQTIIK